MIDKNHQNIVSEKNIANGNAPLKRRRSRRLASTRGIKWRSSDLDIFQAEDACEAQSGWVRLFAGPHLTSTAEENISSLLEIDLNTTVYDLVTLLCLPSELTVYKQIGGGESQRLDENATPLGEQDEFLQTLGYQDASRRKRLGIDPHLCHLISFHLGPAVPVKGLEGYKRCGAVYVLKGLVFPQWKLRPLAVFGSLLFIYPGNLEGTPEVADLTSASVTESDIRSGRFVLQIAPQVVASSPSDTSAATQPSNQALKHIYLGFDRVWEKDLWYSWLISASSSTVITTTALVEPTCVTDAPTTLASGGSGPAAAAPEAPGGGGIGGRATSQQRRWCGRIDLSGSALEQLPDTVLLSLAAATMPQNGVPSAPDAATGTGATGALAATATAAVEEIDLAHNRLSEEAALRPLSLHASGSLRSLRLAANRIAVFPRCLLDCRALRRLDLCDNRLQLVPKDLALLDCLEELKLDRNELTDFPDAVNYLPNLANLQLAENKISNIPEFMKMRATILSDFPDGGNDIDKINKSKLNKVNLRANQLKGCIILGNYGNLTHLDVSENKIENLDLSALDKLEVVHCSRNRLIELSLNGKSLTSIIAGNNELKKINISPSPHCLQHIDLSHNALGHLPAWISACPSLRSLFASHNLLASLPEHMFCGEQTSLRTLQLGYNKLTSLPPLPRQLPLQEMFLQHNSISSLPENFFIAFNHITVLNLSNNRLCQLPFLNMRCASLQKLYLTANCLVDESLATLRRCTNLRVLHAAYNCFKTLPESCIQSWTQLEELVLSGNSIQHIPENIILLYHLKILRVHSNTLQSCPPLSKVSSLRVLDLAHNQLDRINLTLLVPSQLQFLDLSCNTKLHVDSDQFQTYRNQRPMSLVDVSGQNRTSLPSVPRPFHEGGDSMLEPPWKVGFSETAGSNAKLYISQLRLPSFCNTEGLFGIFDGENNNTVPTILEKTVPRILLEERTMKETACEYMKYTMLSAHRELRDKGQKQGVCATVVHISRTKSTAETFIPSARRFVLRVANVGLAKVVLYRRTGAVCLTPSSPKRQLGFSSQFPLVVPDPEVAEINLDEDDEFIIIANKHIWEVISTEAAAEEVRAQSNAILAAKRLQDLAQSYGADDNLSVIVVRFQLAGSGVDQLMRELRHTIRKNKHACEVVNGGSEICQCSCCCDSQRSSCVHCAQILPSKRSSSGDRSSPSGQSDQASSELTVSAKSFQAMRLNNGNNLNRPNYENGPRKISSERRSCRGVAKAVRARIAEERECKPGSRDSQDQSDSGLSEEQYKCWEYMLEQNTQLLFDKELNTLSRGFTRNPRSRMSSVALSRSNPQLAETSCTGTIAPFLSKHFGSARSFNPIVSKSQTRIGNYLNGGPHAAYFGSLQRLMPYNLEYDFAVMQERGNNLDSLDFDSRMQQYWGVATTEL